MVASGHKEAKHIYNLNPANVEYNDKFATRLLFGADAKKLKKQQFKYNENEQEKTFEISKVIPFFDIANGLSEDFLLKAPSRLDAIAYPIKNMEVAAQAKQRAIRKAGRFIVTGENPGSMVNTGLGRNEKEDMEKKLGSYGLANPNDDIIVSTAKDIKPHSLHTPMKQLGLDDGYVQDSRIIRNHFGIPKELYPLGDGGGTYENQKEAYINLVQSVVKTEADDLANTYKSFFDIKETITASFDHLPEMQHIENLKADKALKLSAAIRNINGTGITEEQLFELVGINPEGNE